MWIVAGGMKQIYYKVREIGTRISLVNIDDIILLYTIYY